MGIFGKISSAIGGGVRKFGEFAKSGLSKFAAIKHSYNNIDNAFNHAISQGINSIPVIGPILKGVGSYLDGKDTFKQLEGIIDHARVYGGDLEKLGNKITNHR